MSRPPGRRTGQHRLQARRRYSPLIGPLDDTPETLARLRREAVDRVDTALRAQILEALADRFPDAETATLLAERAAVDPDLAVRRVAVRTLAARWPAHPRLAPLLRRQADRDPDWADRRAALTTLAAVAAADPATAAFLRERAVADEWTEVRQAALTGLIRVAPGQPATFAFLAERVVAVPGYQTRDALAAIAAPAPAAGPGRDWLVHAAEHAADGRVRQAALKALAAGADPALLRRRISGDADPRVRAEAVRALGADSLEELRALAAGDDDRSVRFAAAVGVAAYAPDDRGTLPLLRAHLTDGVRQRAFVLRAVAGSAPAGADWLRAHVRSDEDAGVRRAALGAIVAGWPAKRATFELLLDRAAGDPHWDVRSPALAALLDTWADEPSCQPWLVSQATGSPHRDVRRGALTALAEGWPDDPAVPPLLRDRAANDPDPTVRDAASGLLG